MTKQRHLMPRPVVLEHWLSKQSGHEGTHLIVFSKSSCVSYDKGNGTEMQEWIDDMAAFVRSLDTNHLITVGVTGWYGVSTPARCFLAMHCQPQGTTRLPFAILTASELTVVYSDRFDSFCDAIEQLGACRCSSNCKTTP